MCFSFEVNISSFIISWSISLYLLRKKLSKEKKQAVILLMIFSTIQLFDTFLWYIKMEKNNINYIITSFFIPFVLCAQLFYNIIIINTFRDYLTILLLLILSIYIFVKFNGYSVSLCENKLSSPIWGNNEIKLWEIIIFSILVLYPNWKYIFIVSAIFFPIVYFYIGGSYGSLWRALGNWIAFKYLLLY
jgi:hypothetical protein